MVPGVTLTLMCAGTEPRSEVSDEQGRFRFEDVPTGDCSVVADLQGFKPGWWYPRCESSLTGPVSLEPCRTHACRQNGGVQTRQPRAATRDLSERRR